MHVRMVRLMSAATDSLLRMSSTGLRASNMAISFLLRLEGRCEPGQIVHARPNATPQCGPESDELASWRRGHGRVNGKSDALAAPAVTCTPGSAEVANG